MLYLLNRFTKTMLAELQRGRAIELSKTEKTICFADDFKESFAGLCKRGYVNTKTVMVDGKEILSVYITQTGNFLLDKENAKKLGNVYNII